MTAKAATLAAPAILDGIRDLASSYDLLLCDVWGVLHDGSRGLPSAADALARFRALPGDGRPRRVVLVSNAPRPWEGVRDILDGYGVRRDAYDAILTSGELTRALIDREIRPGETALPVYHLGPERDAGIFSGLEIALVPGEAASLVVCTGLFDDDTETAADYAEALAGFLARGVPMICANPDLVVERAGKLIPCAGLIAAAYAEIGGAVTYAGKPYRPVYEEALAMAGRLDGMAPPALSRVLAIGDALRTDIAGAQDFGIASLLVARGIHAQEIGLGPEGGAIDGVATWLEGQAVHPQAVIDRLAW